MPQLTREAEPVRRHAGVKRGLELLIELENFPVSPHIGAVVTYKHGKVAYELDSQGMTVTFQIYPLLQKKELDEFFLKKLFIHSGLCFFNCIPVAIAQFNGPPAPGFVIEFGGQGYI